MTRARHFIITRFKRALRQIPAVFSNHRTAKHPGGDPLCSRGFEGSGGGIEGGACGHHIVDEQDCSRRHGSSHSKGIIRIFQPFRVGKFGLRDRFPYPSQDPGSKKTWFGFDVFEKLMGQQQGLVKSSGPEPFLVKGNRDHSGKGFLHSLPYHPQGEKSSEQE